MAPAFSAETGASGLPAPPSSGVSQFGATVQLARRELSQHLDRYRGNKVRLKAWAAMVFQALFFVRIAGLEKN